MSFTIRQLDQVTILEDLPRSECFRLLMTQSIGRVGFVHEGRPMVLPVQYVLRNETVLLRTAYGSAFDRAIRGAEVAFEIDSVDPAYHAGWSVMARGIVEGLDDLITADLGAEPHLRPWGLHERPGWVGIGITELTGRRIVQERYVTQSSG